MKNNEVTLIHYTLKTYHSLMASPRVHLKCDGTRAENRFRLSTKRMSPFKSEGASVQLTTGSRGVRISSSNAGYTKSWGSVKGSGYPLQLPVYPSLPLPLRHHVPSHFKRKHTSSCCWNSDRQWPRDCSILLAVSETSWNLCKTKKHNITAHATPEVLAVVVKLHVFRDVMLCQLVYSFRTSWTPKMEAASSITVTIQ
jgi:hypothetical protein